MTDQDLLLRLGTQIGELRGDLGGINRALDGVTEALGEVVSTVGAIGHTCAARGVLHAKIAERLERHSDTLRILRDSSGNILALESTVQGHSGRLEAHEQALRRIGIDVEIRRGQRQAWVTIAREAGTWALKGGAVAAAAGAAGAAAWRGVLAIVHWLGG
jgi:hypothetical protein